MSDLKNIFEQAQKDVTSLAERPDNATMLQLYSLFKQATSGDVQGEKPGMMDFINRAKFEAWEKCKGLTADEAMQKYVDLVESLKA
ncbi:acyl-CoA-binding protein [Crenobacter intestini]|uniref:Acyl-CoA-binding protein n=1 Tax=Crenobacter intestini TaxID=2563443 RepID=A0A4T0URE1_9NEIS|nr:acyl-CoA-binding protein [Crenobacter intestini]TIC81440.1 acyl-CoA-binding protein [Crenobacter intestini]